MDSLDGTYGFPPKRFFSSAISCAIFLFIWWSFEMAIEKWMRISRMKRMPTRKRNDGRVDDPHGVGDADQPVLLQRENEDHHAAEEPQDRVLLPQFPTPHHLQDVEKEAGGSADRKKRYTVHPNLRMQLMRKESVTFTI